MGSSWLKSGAIVSAAAAGFCLWLADTSPRELDQTTADAVRRHDLNIVSGLKGGSVADSAPRRELLLGDTPAAVSKARPRAVVRRRLNARRDPDLEADPEFQKLLEIDSARKMALLEGDEGELRQMRQQVQNAKISRRVLEQALLDPNREVRLAALYEISLEMDEPPIGLLAPVVETDPDLEVRLEALSIIADLDNEEADAVIGRAMNDGDEAVRVEAEELMESRVEELL